MCKKLLFLISFVAVLSLVNGALAYEPGIILRCDAGADPNTTDSPLQAGWTVVAAGMNVDVNGTGLDVKLETGNPEAIALRDGGYGDISGSGPLADVETDFWFANDTQKSPENDVILTLYNLQDGVYILRSYHNRPDEPPVPIKAFTVSGAGTAIYVPVGDFWQSHDCMDEPPEIIFDCNGGGGVAIRYTGPDYADPNVGIESSPQVYFNGFTLEYLGAEMPFSSNPDPAKGAKQVCPGITLSWMPGAYAAKHDIYFGDSMDDVNEIADPCQQDYIGNSWKPTGLKLGTTYFWRVDDVNEPNTWEGMIWSFKTNDGNAFDPFPSDGWRGVSPSASLSWMPGCLVASHNIYFGTTVEDATVGADPCVTGHPTTSWTPSLDPLTTYYWRVEEVNGANTWPGQVQTFKTGHSGGVLMYYKFDGTEGSDLPSLITDDSGNSIQFTRYIGPGGSATYGESNPVIAESTPASAAFDPCAGLYRLDTGENDILRLDGYQYTIEMWINPNSIPDIEGRKDPGAMIIAKEDEPESSLVWSMELRQDRGVDFFHGGNFVGGDNTRQNMHISSGRNVIRAGEWYHIAGVFDLSDPSASQKLYVDGVLVATAARPDQNPPDPNRVGIGAMARSDANFSDFYDGLIDEIRISEVALGPDDFLLVPGPEWARNPSPRDKQRSVDPNVTLMWTPGIYADKHELYIGTSLDYVAPGADPCVTNLDANEYYPGPLEWATTYYWRVDTVNSPSSWEGVVWRFTVRAKVEDPNLIVWYKLDESSGTFAQDWSGHELHGYGDMEPDSWEPNQGHIDGCLVFDNDIAVSIQYGFASYFNDEITVAVWLHGLYGRQGYDDMPVLDGGAIHDELLDGAYSLTALVPAEDGTVAWRAGNDTNDVLIWEQASPGGWRNEWHHFAFVKNEKTQTMTIYLDGLHARSKTGTVSSLGYALSGFIKLGAYTDSDSDYEGKMDDFRMYNRALSAKEIEAIFRGGDLMSAWGPEPYNGQTETPYDAKIFWRKGDLASSHEVYFGTSRDDVNDANNSWDVGTTVFKGKQDATTYDPCLLELATTYYWRIDEVNDSNGHRWTGRIWRFKVAEYIVIDDFEDYQSTIDLRDNGWIEGSKNLTGSYLFLQIDTPVRGEQSMKYVYDNTFDWFTGYYYSEIETINLDPNNWVTLDLRLLKLWFHGKAHNDANATEQMYVGLEDSDGNYAEVRYPMADMGDIRVEEWQEWDVLVSGFTNVNLAKLEKLFIGFGIRYWIFPGGGGIDHWVHFDDIRVYPATCVPSRRPAGFAMLDFNNNCIVDFGDVQIMAEDWLDSDVNLGEVVKPDANGLVAWWKLDEAVADTNIAHDYAGSDNNGVIETLNDDVWWVAAGHSGNALEFDGGRVLVPDAQALRPTDQVSVSAWIFYSETQDHSARIVCKGADNKETFSLEVGGDDECTFLVRDGNDPNADDYPDYAVDSNELDHGEWIHLAGTFDGNSVKCYVNGRCEGTNSDANAITYFGHPLSQDTNDLAIGNRSDDDDREFIGTIDDVRVYNYALSLEEIRYIATDTTGIFSVQSIANVYNKEDLGKRAVNLRDFAELANDWLRKEFWP